jgi:predicted AAA+ superfamily ATPase
MKKANILPVLQDQGEFGKTVIMKQIAANIKNAFYIPVDSIDNADLFEIAKTLYGRYVVTLILLDEIHYRKAYEKDLKKMFDFLNTRIIFSSSVSLSMFESSFDLSRRVRLVNLCPFSFGEYIFF